MAALLADCCATCGSTGPLQKCGKCRVIKYCGGECQVKGWKELGHKRSCGQVLPDQNSELASASTEAVVAWIREFKGASADLAQACVNRLGLAVVTAQDPSGVARAAAASAGATEALLLVCTRHESNMHESSMHGHQAHLQGRVTCHQAARHRFRRPRDPRCTATRSRREQRHDGACTRSSH